MTFSPKDVNHSLTIFDRSFEPNDGPEYFLSVQIDTTRPLHRLFRCIMAIEHKGEVHCVSRTNTPPYYVAPDQIVQVIIECSRRAHADQAGFFKCRVFVSDPRPKNAPEQKTDPCDLDFVITPEIDQACLFLEIHDKLSQFLSSLEIVGFKGKGLDELNAEELEELKSYTSKILNGIHSKTTVFGASQGVAVPTVEKLREEYDGLGFLVPSDIEYHDNAITG